jgi:hypothetical protein
MGFMDKFKDQMAQGQELAKQAGVDAGGVAGAGMPTQAQADYAQLANKIAARGIPCKATINSITPTGVVDVVNKEYAIAVTVEGNGETYDATINQYLTDEALPSYQPGVAFDAKADPDDRNGLLLFGLAA